MVILPTYDSTKVSSLSLTPAQLGSSTTSNSTWTERTLPLTTRSSVAPGFSFNFGVTNDTERGLVLAPRIPFTAVTQDLANTGESRVVWTLTLNTTNINPEQTSAAFYGVTSFAPEAFSTGNDPYTLSITEGSSFLMPIISLLSKTWVQNESGLWDIVLNMNFLSDYTDSVSGATVTSPHAANVNNSGWNGLLQFFIIPSAFWVVTFTDMTFVGKIHDWHTGFMGAPLDVRGRAVHDYKTGQPYMSNEAVADGFLDGIMVHPDNFDPEDPLDTDPFTPPPGEGVVDDELTDIE